jgi:hypothetical protein
MPKIVQFINRKQSNFFFELCLMSVMLFGCGVKAAPSPVLEASPNRLQREVQRRAAEQSESEKPNKDLHSKAKKKIPESKTRNEQELPLP